MAVTSSTNSELIIVWFWRGLFHGGNLTLLTCRAKGKTSSITTFNLSSNTQLFDSVCPQIKSFTCMSLISLPPPLSQKAHKQKEKMAKIMTTFFSQTFGKVTKLNVSRCNLQTNAAEVMVYCWRPLPNTNMPIHSASANDTGVWNSSVQEHSSEGVGPQFQSTWETWSKVPCQWNGF